MVMKSQTQVLDINRFNSFGQDNLFSSVYDIIWFLALFNDLN